jgi:hypothetical protein
LRSFHDPCYLLIPMSQCSSWECQQVSSAFRPCLRRGGRLSHQSFYAERNGVLCLFADSGTFSFGLLAVPAFKCQRPYMGL